MAGRRLSHNQARRVRALHQRHEDESRHDGSGPLRTGVIIARFGKQVELEDTRTPGVLARAHIRANIDSLVAGDRVTWQVGEDGNTELVGLGL